MSAAQKCTRWEVAVLPGGRRVMEKTCGTKKARVDKHPHWWAVTIYRFGREYDRTSRNTRKAARRAADRLLTRDRT